MDNKKRQVREPKQTRGVTTKDKIIAVSYKLFCEKGYYKTTSIEIAKTAHVSIGCFYSYFKDKDAAFFEILDLYNNSFIKITNNISDMSDVYKDDKKKWLFLIIDKLIKAHESSKALNRELIVMYNSNAKVASVLDKHHEKIREWLMDYLTFCESDIKVADTTAAAIIVYDMISSIVNRITSGSNVIDPKRMQEAGIEAINKYLFE